MRKAFNFYRSYWEAAEDLSPTERLKYYEAIMKRQFTGEEVELTGLAKIVYKGQKHSIDAQVLGYEAKKGTLLTPCQGGSQGGTEGGSQAPSVQEKEKEKEKEKGQEKGEGEEEGASAPPHPLVAWLAKECPDVQKLKEPLTNEEAEKLVARFPNNTFIKKVFTDMDNWRPLLQKRKSAYKTFLTWASKDWQEFKETNPTHAGKRIIQ
jgi:hypothetical protein